MRDFDNLMAQRFRVQPLNPRYIIIVASTLRFRILMGKGLALAVDFPSCCSPLESVSEDMPS